MAVQIIVCMTEYHPSTHCYQLELLEFCVKIFEILRKAFEDYARRFVNSAKLSCCFARYCVSYDNAMLLHLYVAQPW